MKNFLYILLLAFSVISCQDDDRKELMAQPEAEEVVDSIQILEGGFVYVADAAVLRGKDFVYGVKLDSISKILAEDIEKFKEDDFDMVPVKVKAEIMKNKGLEGWNEIIKILEIIEIPKGAGFSENIENEE
ncbi:hypothetical protein [Gramella sp. AN32]|uniref:Uncharacterized protein n=1 Tax=Christiangramia antarctica TaxID=2058158 RepID=A0ABW5X106_9FLAO|nr:hypothetical protein [Gramella sp. AN32]